MRVGLVGPANYTLPPRDAAALRWALARASTSVAQQGARTVLLTAFNRGYLELYENWACQLRRVGGLHHLVWAQDLLLARELLGPQDGPAWSLRPDARSVPGGATAGSSVAFFSAHMAGALGVAALSAWSHSFRSDGFNRLTTFKLVAVKMVLTAGYDAWFCDVDVGVLRDPRPFFRSAVDCDYEYASNRGGCEDVRPRAVASARLTKGGRLWTDASREELEQGADQWLEGNTGFHLLRRGGPMLALLQHTLRRSAARPDLDDQTNLWTELVGMRMAGRAAFSRPRAAPRAASPPKSARANRSLSAASYPRYISSQASSTGKLLRYCALARETHLPGGCFPSDGLLPRRAVVAHANFASGLRDKRQKLRRAGLWSIQAPSAACARSELHSWASSLVSAAAAAVLGDRIGAATEGAAPALGLAPINGEVRGGRACQRGCTTGQRAERIDLGD